MIETILILVGILGLLAFWLLRPPKLPQVSPLRDDERGAFELRESLFVNSSELVFYKELIRQCPAGLDIMSKVRLEDVIGAADHIDAKRRFALRGRIKSRHLDFLIIDLAGRPLLAIELDGSAHRAAGASISDRVKTQLCRDAGLLLWRIQTGQNFKSAVGQCFAQLHRHRIDT